MTWRWRAPRRPRSWTLAALITLVAVLLGVYLGESSPPRTIVLATGQDGGMYDTYGREYAQRLGRLGLRVERRQSNGSLDNLRQLLDRRADVAFVQSGTYPLVDDRDGVVRGLASLYVEPLWVFHRGPDEIDGLSRLVGRVVSVGPVDSGTEAVSRALLERHGVSDTGSRLVNLSTVDAGRQLTDGTIDAALFVTSYRDSTIQTLLRRRDVTLFGFRHEDAYTRNFPALGAVKVAAGLFDLQSRVPAEDVTLLAPAAMLASRADLHPRVVETLLKVARAVHGPGDLMNAPQRYPSREGVDIPLHETAERYFTSGESFLSRVLPYWAVRWMFVLPLVIVWFPAMRLLPEIYQWQGGRVVTRYYGKLRDAESALLSATSPAALEEAIAACEALRREGAVLAQGLPAGRQRDMYLWRQHLALVLDEGRERLRSGERAARAETSPAPSRER